MALEIVRPDARVRSPERIILYGRSGIGKTRLSLMLPKTEKWGDILYYAADDSSEALSSIPDSARNRVTVIKPRGEDHMRNFQQFCMTDWKKKGLEKVQTIVVDTFTTILFSTIQQVADEGFISREDHFVIGGKKGAEEDIINVALPSRSDFAGIDSLAKEFVSTIFDKQRAYNIIFVCHEDVKEIIKNKPVGGPLVPGKKIPEWLPGSFNSVFRLAKEPMLLPGQAVPTAQLMVRTQNDGIFLAKLRQGDTEISNKLDKIIVKDNPVNFWHEHDACVSGEQTQGVVND